MDTITLIYDAWKSEQSTQAPRTYLGGSMIGHECERYLWYSFRHCVAEEFSGRMYKLFNRGHLEEYRFVEDLKRIGVVVHEFDKNGKQFEYKDIGGHASGHLDGACKGLPEEPDTWHLLEFKTHSLKSFNKLKKEGCKKSKPQHYAQMQVYMLWSKLPRAYYMSVCKDNDELYGEFIEKDEQYAKKLLERAKRVITSDRPPERCTDKSNAFICRFCSIRDMCWGTNGITAPLPFKSCRTCVHSTAELDGDGRWFCALHSKDIEDTSKPCDKHLLNPHLLGDWATPIDTDLESITYETSDTTFTQGNKFNEYSTEDLMHLPKEVVGKAPIQDLKDILGLQITGKRKINESDQFDINESTK
tara:strand:- start:9516 stop:10592 length:1077 start_codon:yes stop_codon:yes gene_type:complete